MTTEKITSFTKLDAWKVSHQLAIRIYKITRDFPREELFGLTSQLRRCAVSVSSNIAEGFSRQTIREKQQFYFTSLGSLTELQNQILIARDINYIDTAMFDEIAEISVRMQKLLHGLVRHLRLPS